MVAGRTNVAARWKGAFQKWGVEVERDIPLLRLASQRINGEAKGRTWKNRRSPGGRGESRQLEGGRATLLTGGGLKGGLSKR